MKITNEYQHVIDLIDRKAAPIFVTGGAGVGKSTLICYLKNKYDNVITVAPTGIAAINIGASTIHSAFRIPPKFITNSDSTSLKSVKHIANAKLIIIDEISMVNSNLLDAVNYVIRKSKKSDKLFGGIPVVFVGDLYQLPPVVKQDFAGSLFKKAYKSEYFFDARCLRNAEINVIELTKVFRQQDDSFINVLNNIRKGINLEDSLTYINQNALIIDKAPTECVTATTTNKVCDDINYGNLNRLAGDESTYLGKIYNKFPKTNLPAPSILDLKVGAQVMCLRNTDCVVNGTMAIVKSLTEDKVTVETLDTKKLVTLGKMIWENTAYSTLSGGKITSHTNGMYEQIPLKLAWAITVHKSQGQTVNKIHIDMNRGSFASGQLYVALSRCTSLEGISLKRPIALSDIIVDDRVQKFYAEYGI